jgi:tRNA wybutosine-synthesizing protein 1
MLTTSAKQELEKQQYRIVGEHSAVKTCGWTKSMLKGEGGCYKLKFYGIMSHQCMQMTTSMSCANRCTFCWRGYKAPVSKEWEGKVDDPDMIFESSVQAHNKLLIGFKGNDNVHKSMYKASNTIKHVALSLTGEPIMYPKLNELIRRFNREGVSTFLVTNAQYPEQIRDLEPITQLYISLDAPTKELLENVDVPLFKDYWERLNKSLDYLAQKKQRTCMRLTMIKGVNMCSPQQYADLIHKGDPDFIEVKAYMYVGASQERLERSNMPDHDEVVEFTKQLLSFLPHHELVSEHVPSRVTMLAKKKYKKNGKWHTWIDFPKWHELACSGKDFTSDDYLKETPR